MTGTLRVGTSGFAYPDWAPRFYPPGSRGAALLPAYAARLGACELNSTFYRRPSAALLAKWRDAVPDGFRFVVKAQKGASFRALGGDRPGLQVGGGSEAYRPRRRWRRPPRVPACSSGTTSVSALLAAWPRSILVIGSARVLASTRRSPRCSRSAPS
jgi:hypothetical protein